MLKGKIAIVTGANRGIGLETVKVFAEHGAEIWACARAKTEEFESCINELSERYKTIIRTAYFDVSNETEVKDAVKRIGRESKNIDILVNNAGVSIERLFAMTSMEVIRDTIDTNCISQIYLAQLISRYMMKHKSGSIVNIASVSGIESKSGGIAYGISKASIIYSTKSMAAELGKYGIRVNSVSPGFIDTDMWKDRDETVRNDILESTPLHRQGTPREVANAILFLASELSSYITGQNLIVDGGRTR